ncbi:transposase [Lacticaseibacillus pantheris]|nr:transposase [Lacticaseibacillus pantheris]WKF85690.1 transposase [Lacticaseibacillus pantheris]
MTKYSSEFKAKVANEYFQGDITYQALAKKPAFALAVVTAERPA